MSALVYLHGFWGAPQDFSWSHAECPNYTNIESLSPQNFLSDWAQGFLDWTRDQIKSEPLTAVGYSQGGRLLMGAFALAPERFNKLILISAHPGLLSVDEKEARLKSDRVWAQKFRTQPWDLLQKEWNGQGVFQGGKSILREEKDFQREILALCLENWSLAHQPDYRQVLQQHRQKVYSIVGENDLKYAELYSQMGLNLHKAKGAAHRVPSDQPIHLTETLNLILKS